MRAIPFMGADYGHSCCPAVKALKGEDRQATGQQSVWSADRARAAGPGSNQVATFGSNMYLLHRAFPEIVGPEYTLNALDYMLGRHPANNLSLVSTVGTNSKLIAYGHNRADYSYVPGGHGALAS